MLHFFLMYIILTEGVRVPYIGCSAVVIVFNDDGTKESFKSMAT
jgi:hypothetical protein